MEREVVLGIGEEARLKACYSKVESAKQYDSSEKTLKDDDKENGVRVSENGVGDSNLNDSGVIEDCVMNGVSSLLKLKQNFNDKDNNLQEENEDDEEEHGYCVGDFVWGKIKDHQWWPGQIYDPSDASDLALTMKQKGKLLVAYFGDRTFAWCDPSQLKPFAESFKDFSKMNNTTSFLSAIEEAVEEIGRQIERLLVCDCAKENHKFDSPEAKNDGIKKGVLVIDVRRDMISSLLVGKPGEILKDVKSFAESVSFSCLLELEILKRKVSAFYWFKRGYGLPEYHEPQLVPGLEDKNNDDDDGFEWRYGGGKRSSKEEDLDRKKSLQRSLEKCSGFPDHRLHHRRKHKSIAEILENESAAKVRFETEPEDGNVKGELATVTTTTPRRRMSKVSTIEDAQVEESSKGKRKKRDVDDDDDWSGGREETEKNESSNLETDNDSTPLVSLRKRVKLDVSSVERTAGNGETATETPKRERKKSKYLSSDYLSDFSWKRRKKSKIKSESSKVSSQSLVTDASDSFVAMEVDKSCETSLDNAVDFLRLGATAMEMQDLIRVAALGTEYPKDSNSRDMVREFMSIYRSFTYHDGTNSKSLGSYNSSDRDKEELNKDKEELNEDKEEMNKEREELNERAKPETKKREREGKKHKKKLQAEEIEEENEIDKHGTIKKDRKPKKQEDGEETREETSEFSGAELYVTFGPGSRLPKKEEVIEIYEKFGALEEGRTNMLYNNLSARVAFLKIADGEKAFEISQEKCPFTSASTVKFRLKYPNETKMEYVKKKLEEMRSLVDECEGGMTQEVKVKLEDEIGNLVRKMRSS